MSKFMRHYKNITKGTQQIADHGTLSSSLYMAGFLLLSITMVLTITVFRPSEIIIWASMGISSICFALKCFYNFCHKAYSKMQLIILGVIGAMTLGVFLVLGDSSYFISLLACAGVKDSGVSANEQKRRMKKIITMLILALSGMLFIGIVSWFIVLITSPDALAELFHYKYEARLHTFWFMNPNGFSSVLIWTLIGIVYISSNKKKSAVLCAPIVIASYLLSGTRTALLMYALLLIAIFFFDAGRKRRGYNIGVCLAKYSIDLCFLLIIGIVILYSSEATHDFIDTINALLSNRVYHSVQAVDTYGIHILPSALSELPKGIIIDSWFIYCITSLGVLFYFMVSAIFKQVPNRAHYFVFCILMVMAFSLLSERYALYIGRCWALLVITESIFAANRTKRRKGAHAFS